MTKRTFEVHGTDPSGDIWVVGTELRESAEAIAKKFCEDKYTDVVIVENLP